MYLRFLAYFSWKEISRTITLQMQYMPVWKIQWCTRQGCITLFVNISPSRHPFNWKGYFWNLWNKTMVASSLSYSARASRSSCASLSKMCLLRYHYTTPSGHLCKCNNCFCFFLDSDLSHGIPNWTLWESDLHKKIVWLGFPEGAEHSQSWQALGSAFAQKTAAASHSGCLVVKKEKDDAGDRLSDLGDASLPGLLKVVAFDLFSLRLRKYWKSSLKNVHLE